MEEQRIKLSVILLRTPAQYTEWANSRYRVIIFTGIVNDGRELKYRTKKVDFEAALENWKCRIDWPPRSPDLTPMDFFFWGVVKNKVYERKPQTVDEMKEFITDAFMDTDSDRKVCRTVCQSVSDRLDACCNVDGGHFEHLRD